MPNDVYRYTHAALSALVSPRVAHAILEDALSAKGFTTDDVTTRAMRHLLAGAVRKELSRTLPRTGLTSTLKRLAEELAQREATGPLRPTPVTAALIAEDDAERVLSTLSGASAATAVAARSPASAAVAVAPPPAEVAPAVSGALDPGFGPLSKDGPLRGRTIAQVTRPAPSEEPAPAPAKRAIPRLSEPAQESALRLFGDIEDVRQVVVVRRHEVLLSRGQGVEERSLPNLVLSSRRLLARAGDLRTLSVERAGGVLFLFPFGEDTLVVVTFPHVNIGAVLNARAALEEAA